jgi:hypothetical protein
LTGNFNGVKIRTDVSQGAISPISMPSSQRSRSVEIYLCAQLRALVCSSFFGRTYTIQQLD